MANENEEELENEEDDEEEDEDEESDDDEGDDDDDDDDDDIEVSREELLDDIAELVAGIDGAVETDVDEDAGTVTISMNDESKWKLTLRRIV